MTYRDLREFVAQLEAAGELRRVREPVSPHLEMTALCDRVLRAGGPALLFEQPSGHATPHIARRFARLNRRTVDINNYPLPSELADGVQAATAGRSVCYIGGIGLIRGALEMVSALEHVDATLLLAGAFENAGTEARLRALPGWRKVNYRGSVSRAEVRRIMAASRAGLIFFHPEPNHVDAQPNKMFEYMSAGLPVLASDFPLWRSLLEDAGAGRCADPLDPHAIAACIAALLDDPVQAQAMGERGRRAVHSVYHWAHEEKKLVQLYRDVMGEVPA